MLTIINSLKPFFEDNYRRINVREYARIQKISPPTASKLLSSFKKEGLIKEEKDKQFIYYYANKESCLFIDLSRIYWRTIIQDSGLVEEITKNFLNPIIILFGSLAKAEVKLSSDIDLAIFTPTKKDLQVNRFEKVMNKKIQIFRFSNKEEIKSKELLNNILNGYRITGEF